MKLSEMRQILATHDIRLTKSLGQNFLHDGNQLRRIVAAAELTATDRVLEIGPGLGPLTEALLAECGHVFAIEKDRRLVEVLERRFANEPKLRLLHADALDYLRDAGADFAHAPTFPTDRSAERRLGVDLAHQHRAEPVLGTPSSVQVSRSPLVPRGDRETETPSQPPTDWRAWKLVANLPYSVGSPMLVELCRSPRGPKRLVATLQLEVAQRLAARAGDDEYGLLSLLIQLRYEPRGMFRIPASCFFPAPEIDSACVTLVRRPAAPLGEKESAIYDRVIRRGFSQRRKKLFKLLKEDWAEAALTAAFAVAKVPTDTRAEQVSREQFIELARQLANENVHAHAP